MQDNKLIKIFKSLNHDEFKYLRWFVQSNIFNTDTNLVALFDTLSKHFPNFQAKGMNKESLFAKVFPGQHFNDAKWRNLVSKMNKLAESYLVWLELQSSEFTQQKLLTQAYGRRNLYQLFEKNVIELSAKLENASQLSADAMLERMQVNLQFYHHPKTTKIDNFDKLELAMDDLDHYYFAEKLRLASDIKVFQNMVKDSTNIRLKSEVLQLVEEGELRELIYLKVYSRILKLLEQSPTISVFEFTLDFFIENAPMLSLNDKQFGLLHLLNVAINQANKGEVGYRPLVLKLYKTGLELGVLLTGNTISDTTFINIVSTASGLKEFEWARMFIDEYETYLAAENRQETKAFSLGYLLFFQAEYEGVIQLLTKQSFENFNRLLSSKNLLLRCYFELFLIDITYYTLFVSYAKAFDKFVKREKQLSEVRKEWYKNLISALLVLTKLRYERTWNKHTKSKLLEDVSPKPMYLKSWLLDRIAEL